MYRVTPLVKNLLIANAVMFILSGAMPRVANELALYPPEVFTHPWTIFTYMFLHAGLMHLAFNMLGLFFFGPRLEVRLGSRDFLILYFAGGIGGAVFSILFAPGAAVVGASAAVYAVMAGFAMFWPQERIYIWGIFPVQAWVLVIAMVGISLWSGINQGGSSTAHFAHLGGLACGFVYLKWREWHSGAAKRDFKKKLEGPLPGIDPSGGDRAAIKRWESIDTSRLHELNREEVVHLLDKARIVGARGLTPAERQFLDRLVAPPVN
jgi:membrane associated rhomboid family serine protease